MALRFCVYKNCENFVNLHDRSFNNDITFFSFPKNPERRQKWMEYGQAQPDLPKSKYYFCSQHFDKKFLGVSNRRTCLVGEAVPFPYVEPEIEKFQADSSLDYYFHKMNKDSHQENNEEIEDEQELHAESTRTMHHDGLNEDGSLETGMMIMNKNDIILIEPSSSKAQTKNISANNKSFNKFTDKTVEIINLNELNAESTTDLDNSKEHVLYEEHFSLDLEDDSTPVADKDIDFILKPCKRKFEENNFKEELLTKYKIPKESTVKIKNFEEKLAAENKETEDEEIDLDKLIDAKHVTTFIFKGEEYVQMPKDFYIREKMEIDRKLQKMVQEKMEIDRKLQKMVRTVKVIKEYINILDV